MKNILSRANVKQYMGNLQLIIFKHDLIPMQNVIILMTIWVFFCDIIPKRIAVSLTCSAFLRYNYSNAIMKIVYRNIMDVTMNFCHFHASKYMQLDAFST